MKRTIHSISIFLLLMNFISCSDDTVQEEYLNSGYQQALKCISITGADFQTECNSRSTVVIDNNGVQFLWSANDTVGVFPNKGSQAEFAIDEGVGMQTATFNGGGWALKQASTYSAYYPYNFYNRNLARIPVNYAGQTQEGNASTSHIATYDYMAAGVVTPEHGVVSFDMQHMGCLVMLQAQLGEEKKLTRVILKSAQSAFVLSGFMDLTAENPSITSSYSVDTLTIDLHQYEVTEHETSTIYFMMVPVNLLGENLEITLYDELGAYMKFNAIGKNFVAGKAYAFQLTDGEKVGPGIPEYAVDLGLPSGTLWADRNVGADAPEAYGDFFAWGETIPKETYLWTTYKWCSGSSTTMTKYCTKSAHGTVDGKTTLDVEDDAAYVNMGKEWRLPTAEEQNELINKCTRKWVTQNGVQGYLLTGPNNNSIFLPAAGYFTNQLHLGGGLGGYYGRYWSSTLFANYSDCANTFYFDADGYILDNRYNRYCGHSIRAVVR